MKISEHIDQQLKPDLTLSETPTDLENWYEVIESDYMEKAVQEANMKNADVLMQ